MITRSVSRSIQYMLIGLLIIPATLYSDTSTADPHADFSFALIQFEISESLFSEVDAIEAKLDELVKNAIDRSIRDGQKVDLIVFPEYTSVFLSLAYAAGPALAGVEQFADLFTLLDEPNRTTKSMSGFTDRIAIAPAFEIALEVARRGNPEVDRFWKTIAKQYEVDIVAGTYFAIDSISGRLKNRSIVFSRNGRLLYFQDKVFLTPFEIDMIGLSPGFVGKARTFAIRGQEVAITICRDSFFEVWERNFAEATLWFDIKANGTEYTEDEAKLFQTALPERIGATGVPIGGTACLTGRFFDLFWEGESSIVVFDESDGFRFTAIAGSHDRESVVLFYSTNSVEE